MFLKSIQASKVVSAYWILLIACSSGLRKEKNSLDLQELQHKSQEIVDSIILDINKKNYPYFYADSILRIDISIFALKKIDSLILLNPKEDKLFLCRGYWFYLNKIYDSALFQYQLAVKSAPFEYPLLLERQAQTYLELKLIDEAIQKYRVASSINNSYYYKLACAFELNKKFDSASHYFSLYFRDKTYTLAEKAHYDSFFHRKISDKNR